MMLKRRPMIWGRKKERIQMTGCCFSLNASSYIRRSEYIFRFFVVDGSRRIILRILRMNYWKSAKFNMHSLKQDKKTALNPRDFDCLISTAQTQTEGRKRSVEALPASLSIFSNQSVLNHWLVFFCLVRVMTARLILLCWERDNLTGPDARALVSFLLLRW